MSLPKKSQKSTNNFFCENCNYITVKKCDYMKHLSTRKHEILQNPTLKSQKVSKIKNYE